MKILENENKEAKKILSVDLDWCLNEEQTLKIISFCFNIFQKKIPTYFIKSHHLAYPLLEDNCILFNVDHHHDLWYFEGQFQNALSGRINEPNWVSAAIFHKKIEGLVWVKNYTSEFKEDLIEKYLRDLKYLNLTNKIEDIYDINFDKLIICESYKYNNNTPFIFELLKNLCHNINHKYTNVKTDNELGIINIK